VLFKEKNPKWDYPLHKQIRHQIIQTSDTGKERRAPLRIWSPEQLHWQATEQGVNSALFSIQHLDGT